MAKKAPLRLNTIHDYHRFRGLPMPEHPLISLINFSAITLTADEPQSLVFGFYTLALRRHSGAAFKYGQQEYDYKAGVMLFMAPEQVFGIQTYNNEPPSGWLLMIHPDFLWNTPLAHTIKQYAFFDYAVHEGLCLSQKEECYIIDLLKIIQREYHHQIDSFSHKIMIAQLELLLAYSARYYNRQFLTRRHVHHKLVTKLEMLLNDYFEKRPITDRAALTVQQVAAQLHVSPNYLSGLLKRTTGLSTQQHIQNKIIEKAKERLSTTDLSVSEIAYELGFEYAQSFNKLFKKKTDISPLTFRQSFK
ncbi:helix-turn-helix domain-containing protein [Olivibacter ginsenosidimutans]|uniref:Helix-turn-helix domain-containing protein n=1 Tax=Olivibacter ginsenosidimutans TaxID=1176537 RepID=A0ABP9BIZ1_9SPHI